MEAARNQDQIFALSEANQYFERNRSALSAADWKTDLPLRLIELYQLKPRNVLEVGAANGFRLAAIAMRLGARAVALEPSDKAIADGKVRFSQVEFHRGLANRIPLDELFDLVIVNFVLHWVARETLLKSITEIDRLVTDGGFLIVGDFAPANQLRKSYHHLPTEEVYTYKQNYAAIFTSSGLYHIVGSLTTDHSEKDSLVTSGENDRIGVYLLRKNLRHHYVTESANY